MRGATRTGRLPTIAPFFVVALIALMARVAAVLFRGGYGGYFNYDSGVYYAAADALIHGRLPYRDFTLVHPPASMLTLTPFAAIGSATTDQTGYVLANLAFSLVGALAAVVVMLVVRQLVPGRLAMWVAGLFYALYPGAVRAEIEARLEPLANLLLLLGLLAMLRAGRSKWWIAAFGGAALALSVSVKIWYVVPAAVVALGYLVASRRRTIAPALGGAVVALLVVDGPFFVAAPRAMFHAVVTDQLGRPTRRTDLWLRLTDLSGQSTYDNAAPLDYHTVPVAAVLTAVVLAGLLAACVTARAGRLPAAMLVVQLIVLLRSPSFFHFYTDYMTPAIAVCAGVTCSVMSTQVRRHLTAARRRRTRTTAFAVIAAATAFAVVYSGLQGGRATAPYRTVALERAAAGAPCVMSDTPEALIQLDALSRGLARGCRNWIDVTGRRLGPDRDSEVPGVRFPDAKWKRDFAKYVLSGDAVALVDGASLRMSYRLIRILGNAQLLARSGTRCLVKITDVQRRQLRSSAALPPVFAAGADPRSFAATVPWCPKTGPVISAGSARVEPPRRESGRSRPAS